jgi:hypothetical protein
MAFGRVANLSASPASLLKPDVMLKVWWTNLKQRAPQRMIARLLQPAWEGRVTR